tara:strand:+ start:389 stop:739 length:351 start_codon:yes stop_codon:yes gene_type:complete
MFEDTEMNEFELCGWIGAVLVLVAYIMVSTGKAKADSRPYQLTNIIGALFLVAYTYNCQAYASMVVNVIWAGIGFTSFIKFIKISKLKFNENYLLKTKLKFATVLVSVLALFVVVL